MKEQEILVISFSNIARDARVLRELSVVTEFGHVTTVGYGAKPKYSDEHIQISDAAKSLPQTPIGILKLALHLHKAAELSAPGNKEAMRLLQGHHFNTVIANDARALPLAFWAAKGSPVWADLHEWAPEERTHVRSWRILVAPMMRYLCKKYLPRCAATSTVSSEIAELYQQHFDVTPYLIRNAAPFADLNPSKTAPNGIIRLVHSGGAVYGRNIETMIQAVIDAGDRVSLDLYLVPANDGGKYLQSLKDIAAGNPRITFHNPVKPQELAITLNQYDVGIYWIPPYNVNAELALPNKIFDFVQGRLAIAIGPTKEMARIVNQYQIGTISNTFEKEDIVNTLKHLTVNEVAQWKEHTPHAAQELSFEHEAQTIRKIMNTIIN